MNGATIGISGTSCCAVGENCALAGSGESKHWQTHSGNGSAGPCPPLASSPTVPIDKFESENAAVVLPKTSDSI